MNNNSIVTAINSVADAIEAVYQIEDKYKDKEIFYKCYQLRCILQEILDKLLHFEKEIGNAPSEEN